MQYEWIMRDARREARLRSSAQVLWSVAGDDFLQLDRLADISAGGCRISTESLVGVGREVRLQLLTDDGEQVAAGIGRVIWSDGGTCLGLEFVDLHIDPTILEAPAPPPLPGLSDGPPPLRPERMLESLDDGVAPQVEPLELAELGTVIGIDLGTTNTCVSFVHEGRPHIIPGRTGTNTIPSMVHVSDDGVVHVGQRAADRAVLHPRRTVYGSKRLLGRTYAPEIARQVQRHFAYPLAEAKHQRFGIDLGDRVLSMDQVASTILAEVKLTAEAYLGKRAEGAVITVPAYFNEAQRDAVRRAGERAGMIVHRIVNEPTAAAVAYGHARDEEARVAVWDLGGGTFDLSVVDISGERYTVLATGGDDFLGGTDFDDALAAHLYDEYCLEHILVDEPTPQQIARLREAAEEAKRALSVQSEYTVRLADFSFEPRRHLEVSVTRDTFEGLIAPLVDRMVEVAKAVMTHSGVEPEAVDDVVLVGGASRVPAIHRAAALLFHRRPSLRVNPDEAVALGAAVLADEIGHDEGVRLFDILPMTIACAGRDGAFVPMVEKLTRVPAEGHFFVEVLKPGSASVPLFQGNHSTLSENEYLYTAVISEPSLAIGDRVVLKLSLDEHLLMVLEAQHGVDGHALPVTLDRERPLDDILEELGFREGATAGPSLPPPSTLSRLFGKLFRRGR